jgi:hypothetical protein
VSNKGRPTKLNQDTQSRIVQAIELGATYELAASYAGITYDTLNGWVNRAKAELDRREKANVKPRIEEQLYIEFFHALKTAEGRAAVKWLAKIEQAASEGNWQAAAWKLERRYPQEYGRRVVDTRTDITSGGKPMAFNVTAIDYRQLVDVVKPDDDTSAT